MYSRSYYPEDGGLRIPDGYDGTALLEPKAPDPPQITELHKEPAKKEVKVSPRETDETEACSVASPPAGEESTSHERWQIPTFLKNIIPDGFGLSSVIPGIGSEELLIAAIALFLFFSKGGDKLCAGILLFLIFIK